MITFIAKRIMECADRGLEIGKTKYAAYFSNTAMYVKYKEEVDVILTTDGYAECIIV